ncbi:hypothetical protein K505DRAFT_295637 [Melanomma pulvis-pyrius CBS 109.77]|uniref:RCC1/BLIP-II n=1 Tax=Melanomma pulvis-pyrius CBS 109.77 TaxID=1314802 RepID=A0A6A6XRT5_9PLEO|nr:hypothetical protein K505DRAFT_295637 [Melanomma pulvis-pyrius CBS 109.77]
MELYTFGFNGHAQLQLPSPRHQIATSKDNILTPRLALQSQSIQVLWSSWCDSLIAYHISTSTPTQPKIVYTGTGLSSIQTTHIEKLAQSTDNISHLQFFGTPLGSGLQGILNTANSEVTFFARDASEPSQEISTHTPPKDLSIHHISLTSGGHISLNTTLPGATETNILAFPTLAALIAWLDNTEPNPQPTILSPNPPQLFTQIVSNATTTTALTTTGLVCTWTPDPRYPKLLGRPVSHSTPSTHPHPLPYLSETEIVKISSGGYLTAALSSDGELFIWGQACPGSTSTLSILDGELPSHPEDSVSDPHAHVADHEADQDEFVRCVELKIRGREARVTHVAVGSGHVIVAAESAGGRNVERSVFAAGQGESGQLGVGAVLEFTEGFREVEWLRGRKVLAVEVEGWSSWVVAKYEGMMSS